jgi:hypothetical protein
MAPEGAQVELRSVMFLGSNFDHLLYSSTSGFTQLDGVLELLNFANNYVLSDRVAIGGALIQGLGEISKFLAGLARETKDIEVIGHGPRYTFDQSPFEDRSRMDFLDERITELSHENKSYSDEERQCFDEINLLEARAYILLADAVAAAYVPDRLFGVRALESYSGTLDQSTYLQEHETFRRELIDQLRSGSGDDSIVTAVPSFLLEASRNAQNWQGMFAAMRDIRDSDAAQHYRDLVRRSRSDDPNVRRESRVELVRNSRAAFEREGLSGGLNRWIVPTVGLSAAAIGFLFPMAAPIFGLVAAVPPVIESLHGWCRDRNNLFEFYNHPVDSDLYDELSRIFPSIKFHRENLSHFLSKRDFGWSENLNFWRTHRA